MQYVIIGIKDGGYVAYVTIEKDDIKGLEIFKESILTKSQEIFKSKYDISYTKTPEIKSNRYVLYTDDKIKFKKDKEEKKCKMGFVYSIYDLNENLLYIGSTLELNKRLKEHLMKNSG